MAATNQAGAHGATTSRTGPAGDPLPSWRAGASKQAIQEFIQRVTAQGSPHFVPREERVAVFDNDGTLWCEKPMPIQADFLLQRLATMADQDPSLRTRQPWKAAYDKDYGWLGSVITNHYHGNDRDVSVLLAGVLQAFGGITVRSSRPKPTRSCTAPSTPPWAAATWPAATRRWWSCWLPGRQRVPQLHRLRWWA